MAERRALVIGNDDYANVPKLRKAIGDAEAMKSALEKLGFSVSLARNVDRDGFGDAIDGFTAEIDEGDEALIFYAGHGIAIDGRNFLLPIDIKEPKPGQERRVERSAYDAGTVVETIREKKPKYIFAVLDACRNNPFEGMGRSVGQTRGLARMEAEPGAFILFSAGPGESALDRLGNDDNEKTSVFTRVLLKHIGTPGLTLQGIAKATQRNVRDLALTIEHQQFPDYSDRMSDEPVLVAGGRPDAGPTQADPDMIFRLALLDRSDVALKEAVQAFPKHPRAQEVFGILEARADDAAFDEAKKAGTIAALETYRRDRPRGRHVDEVARTIAALTPSAAAGGVSIADVPTGPQSPLTLDSLVVIGDGKPATDYSKDKSDVVRSLAISPDGRRLAMGTSDFSAAVKIWDLKTGRLERAIALRGSSSGSLAYSPDGRLLAAEEEIIEIESGRVVQTLPMRPARVAFTSDGRFLAAAEGGDGVASLWDVQTGEKKKSFPVDEYEAEDVSISPDGRLLAAGSGSHSKVVKVWDIETENLLFTLKPHAVSAASVAFSPDGRLLASGGHGNALDVWNVSTGKSEKILKGAIIHQIAFSPDGRMVAAAYNDSFIKLWDVKSGRVVRMLQGHRVPVRSLAFSPDGRMLVSSANTSGIEAGETNTEAVRVWEVASGRLLAGLQVLPNNEWMGIGDEGFTASSNHAFRYVARLEGDVQTPIDEAFRKEWMKETLTGLAPFVTASP